MKPTIAPPLLRHLDIKPILACNANCKPCFYRRELYKEINKTKILSIEQWDNVLSEAKELGAKELIISGGEPTLYKNLIDLIKIGKRYQMHVCVNTNGSLITEEFAKNLVTAGLDEVRISIYSPKPKIHDEIRSFDGLWEKATNAVRIFRKLTKKNSSFNIIAQTIIFNKNYRDLPELFQLYYELGVTTINLSYIEGDFTKQYLLKETEIEDFKRNIIPKLMEFCALLDKPLIATAKKAVEHLYGEDIASISEFAKGIYRPGDAGRLSCQIPKHQALILANGDIHPCNIVEYTHEPVVGNLFMNTFSEIWQGSKWNDFRKKPFDYCSLCPVTLHPYFAIRDRTPMWTKIIRQPLFLRGKKIVKIVLGLGKPRI